MMMNYVRIKGFSFVFWVSISLALNISLLAASVPVFHYTFNQSNALGYSETTYSATTLLGISYFKMGMADGCAKLSGVSGTNSIGVAHCLLRPPTFPNITNRMSVSLWFNDQNNLMAWNDAVLWYGQDSRGGSWDIKLFIKNGNAPGTPNTLVLATKRTNVWQESGIAYNYGGWNHVATVFSNGYVSLYLNNNLLSSVFRDYAVFSGSVNTFGNNRFPQRDGPFNGLMDDIRIYKTNLSALEVSTIYTERGKKIPFTATFLTSAEMDYSPTASHTLLLSKEIATNRNYLTNGSFVNGIAVSLYNLELGGSEVSGYSARYYNTNGIFKIIVSPPVQGLELASRYLISAGMLNDYNSSSLSGVSNLIFNTASAPTILTPTYQNRQIIYLGDNYPQYLLLSGENFYSSDTAEITDEKGSLVVNLGNPASVFASNVHFLFPTSKFSKGGIFNIVYRPALTPARTITNALEVIAGDSGASPVGLSDVERIWRIDAKNGSTVSVPVLVKNIVKPCLLRVTLYDLSGRKGVVLFEEKVNAGTQNISPDDNFKWPDEGAWLLKCELEAEENYTATAMKMILIVKQ